MFQSCKKQNSTASGWLNVGYITIADTVTIPYKNIANLISKLS